MRSETSRNFVWKLVSGIVLVALVSAPCAAQQLTISGTVDDTYGVVQGVSVTLRAPSGTMQRTTTDERGRCPAKPTDV